MATDKLKIPSGQCDKCDNTYVPLPVLSGDLEISKHVIHWYRSLHIISLCPDRVVI